MSISDREYRLKPSRSYVSLSAILHSGAVMSLWWAGLDPGLSLLLTTVILTGLIHDLRATGLRRSPGAVHRIQVGNGEFSIFRNDGSTSGPARIRSGWALGYAVLLCLGSSSWRRAIVVVPADALSSEGFRHLRTEVRAALDVAEPA